MELLYPYKQSIECAQCFTPSDLKAQVRACREALEKNYDEWLDRHRICLEEFASGQWERAIWWSGHAYSVLPDYITDQLCEEHRAILHKKSPKKYVF